VARQLGLGQGRAVQTAQKAGSLTGLAEDFEMGFLQRAEALDL